jgi:glycosyltransferase involved in cell wall biosynthesis
MPERFLNARNSQTEMMDPQTAPKGKAPVSLFILTHNEELNITACLESVRWAGEAFVLDAGSTDRTVEMARSLGAQVYSHAFEGYWIQRNWGLDHLPFTNPWVLVLDADERIPPALAEEIQAVTSDTANSTAGYYLDRRFFFMGKSLRHGSLSPNWILRLFKRQAGRFEERPFNEHVILQGPAGYLKNPLHHIDLRPLSTWISKHNRYADLQAEEYLGDCEGRFPVSLEPSLSGSPVQKKRWVRLRLWNRLPLLIRPFLYFLRNYILKGGFLDGKPGFIYHVLWSFWFPFLVDVKILERKAAGKRKSSPAINPPDTR